MRSSPLSTKAPEASSKTRPNLLIIAGNDSNGMAGIARDIQTAQAFKVHAKPVITACTGQNSSGLHSLNASTKDTLANQLLAHTDDNIAVIKIGMIANAEQVDCIEAYVQTLSSRSSAPKIVLDPVLAASSGETLNTADLVNPLKDQLFKLCTLITPNINEAEALCGFTIKSKEDMQRAAQTVLALGTHAVLIKGGHFPLEKEHSEDYFHSKEQSFWLSSERVETNNTRGSGCTLATSIAGALALGYSIEDAVVIGKMTINQGIRHAYRLDTQAGPINVQHFPNAQQDLPKLTYDLPTNKKPINTSSAFPPTTRPSGETCPLGLYPVVDSANWLNRILPLGITTAQLRVKDLQGDALAEEIRQAVKVAAQYDCRLFINDYWELAIESGAYGVHLGQEDLHLADIGAIHAAGLRLGLSTHCHYEAARAHNYQPSYIAVGPVFHTDTKKMPWVPRGPEGFAYWSQTLDYPLVAIGGINQDRISALMNAGADGIAMITAITLAENPEQTAAQFMHTINTHS
ncbi:MAG: thiamine-phosphate pyrophosphorylase [Alteromonadaceae bacterium]|nr:MAG: thiamine-phosphate pyrophosphorylase [Alteromonadaceae bacterium]